MTLAWKRKENVFLFSISQIETISKLIVRFIHLLSSSIIQIAKKTTRQLPSFLPATFPECYSPSLHQPQMGIIQFKSEISFAEGFL